MNIFPSLGNDKVGILASTLCLIHCFATPFLFIAKTCSVTCCASSPNWWIALDYVFLLIAFFAIRKSTSADSYPWVRKGMWGSWIVMLLVLVNEQVAVIPLFEGVLLAPAFALISLHIYNLKYRQSSANPCCAI